MAFTFTEGTRTAGTPPEASFTVLGTTNDTNDGVYQFFIDASALVGGATPDTLEIQVLETVKAGGTQRLIFEAVLAGVQDEPIWCSPSLVLGVGWQIQIKQTTGTARSFDWSIRKVA